MKLKVILTLAVDTAGVLKSPMELALAIHAAASNIDTGATFDVGAEPIYFQGNRVGSIEFDAA